MKRFYSAVFLCIMLFPSGSAEAARLWSSGCELQGDTGGNMTDLLEWDRDGTNAASTQVSTSVQRSGLSSCRILRTSSGWGAFIQQFSSGGAGPFYFRFYLYIRSAPGDDVDIAALESAGGSTHQMIVLRTDRTLRLIDADDVSVLASYNTPLQTNTWYRFEWMYSSNGAGSAEVRLDGTSVMSVSSHGGSTIANYILGLAWDHPDTTGEWYFDDVSINDTTGSFQNSWPGEGRIVHMQPDGTAGDNNDASSGNCASADEITPDDGSTIAVLNDNGDNLDCAMEYPVSSGVFPGSVVKLVQVGIREAASGAASETWDVRIKSASGGTVANGTDTNHDDTTYRTNGDTAPRNYKLTSYTDPTTGGTWTALGTNSLDTMQIGVNAVAATSADINVSTLWALVEFVDQVARINNKGGSIKVIGGKLKFAI